MSMTDEQEKLYQYTITSLLVKIDRRDEVIQQLRKEITRFKKQNATRVEDGCNGVERNNS
jgi:hypothetical protein